MTKIQEGGQLVSVQRLVSDSTADLGEVVPELAPASRELQVNQVGAILAQSAHVGNVAQATESATQQGTERGREIFPLLLRRVGTKHVDGDELRKPQQEGEPSVLGLAEVGQFVDVQLVHQGAGAAFTIAAPRGGFANLTSFLCQKRVRAILVVVLASL